MITSFFKAKTIDSGSGVSSSSSSLSSKDLEAEKLILIEKKKQAAAKLLEARRTINSFTICKSGNFKESTWIRALQPEFKKPYFTKLMKALEAEYANKVIYPPLPQIFTAFNACPFDQIKVVIIGQDPYHGPNQAHGLSFSVIKPRKAPPSLVNIFKELDSDLPSFKIPSHGDLSSWANQGVFLLNATLTVVERSPNSHSKLGWANFTDAAIQALSSKRDGLVFLLWGKNASEKARFVDKTRHTVLKSAHPSPYSATRFFGCKHFSKANEALKKRGIQPINWNSINDQ